MLARSARYAPNDEKGGGNVFYVPEGLFHFVTHELPGLSESAQTGVVDTTNDGHHPSKVTKALQVLSQFNELPNGTCTLPSLWP